MLPQWIIEKKRDKRELSEEEIDSFIQRYTEGEIPDYQMSALAMAIFLNGMSFDEITWLTQSMMNSGDIVDTRSIDLPKIDKHSTGGIGDKVSLILAPLVAACDVAVPMISGRGLDITGGTLDKLGVHSRLPDRSEREGVSPGHQPMRLLYHRADRRSGPGRQKALCPSRRNRHRAFPSP